MDKAFREAGTFRLDTRGKARFYDLLYTWPRGMRGNVARVWKDVLKSDLTHLEEQYGDKHFEERRERLEAILNKLSANKTVDLNAVLATLEEATEAAHQALRQGQKLDRRRDFELQRARLKKDLTRWVAKLEKFYAKAKDEIYLHGDLGFVTDISPSFPVLSFAHRLLKAVEYDDLMTVEVPALRRSRRGHPSAPWVKDARRALARARVPSTLRTELLMVVGLIQYRA